MTTTQTQSPFTVGHRTLTRVAGPLVIVDGMDGVGYGELVEVETGDGPVREGQVLELDRSLAVVQVFGGTVGIGRRETSVLTRGRAARTGVGADYFGRVLDGAGRPRDGGPQPVPDDYRHVNGLPLNPITRAHPDQFIETGVSAIDGLVTLVRGQKLPIFSGAGLPANSLAARIAAQARVPGDDAEVVVIFAAMGVTRREAEFFRSEFLTGGAASRSVLLLNLADDPTIERLLTPRVALTLAEYLAFEHHRHVLVVMTDMTAYCEALREISAAREEMPGRRGYPGYMYTDLASLYERAGRVRDGSGSLTQLMILTMPDDDITHPIPDLTGYITEGQIVLSRDLDRQGIQPPIDVLPSLSRLMNAGIGAGKTRDDHRGLADQLYACYARGREVRRLMSIVGESGLPVEDRRYLAFAAAFERTYLDQGPDRRTLTDTLEVGWQLLSPFPAAELKRVSTEQVARHHHEAAATATDD
ncbi:V/A-type H+-transporting ATPase subunit B [Kribbella steppae]|uniref:V-type ATP synthase beta chain n=1 Tax=Kribbella steppae TaxID=2512223 RepID=A0A4R2H2Z2_9ACTN|nr:V-type ATP synthase subunit B [Kribbella steppae]TCO19631.1 V/A-type H+-transporting ATPase subunit B [Kribbella steppae]